MIRHLATQGLLFFGGGESAHQREVFTGHRRLIDANDERLNAALSGEELAKIFGTLDKLKEPDIQTSYAWNVFRYSGDFLHLIGCIVFILTCLRNKAVTGFSEKTQRIYLLIYVTRYLDLFTNWRHQTSYLIAFKIMFIALSTISVAMFYRYRSSYERPKDTCSLFLILICGLVLMVLLSKRPSFLEYMRTFSLILEAVCLVPQYVFRYRDNENTDMGVFIFIFCLGGYRVLYMCNWIYRRIENPHYNDISSWITGLVEILLFIDFLMYRLIGFSILRTFVLGVDDRIGWVSDSVEFRILGKIVHDDEQITSNADSELRQRKKPSSVADKDKDKELEEFDPMEV